MSVTAISLFKDVSGLDEEVSDTVVPDGETWLIRRFSGNAAYLDDTTITLLWDPAGANEILSLTHGDSIRDLNKTVTGNGVKVIRLALTNDTSDAHMMGGTWEAKKL